MRNTTTGGHAPHRGQRVHLAAPGPQQLEGREPAAVLASHRSGYSWRLRERGLARADPNSGRVPCRPSSGDLMACPSAYSLLKGGGLMGSVIKKRRKRMAKKKHRKLLKKTRIQRRNKK